jgi:hypothetical protein
MANDPRTGQDKTLTLDAGSRTVGWTILASVCGVLAFPYIGFLGTILLAATAYAGFKAYQAKQEERAALINNSIQSYRNPAEPVIIQQCAPEPAQSTETKWQAAVSKTSSPAQNTGRGA